MSVNRASTSKLQFQKWVHVCTCRIRATAAIIAFLCNQDYDQHFRCSTFIIQWFVKSVSTACSKVYSSYRQVTNERMNPCFLSGSISLLWNVNATKRLCWLNQRHVVPPTLMCTDLHVNVTWGGARQARAGGLEHLPLQTSLHGPGAPHSVSLTWLNCENLTFSVTY